RVAGQREPRARHVGVGELAAERDFGREQLEPERLALGLEDLLHVERPPRAFRDPRVRAQRPFSWREWMGASVDGRFAAPPGGSTTARRSTSSTPRAEASHEKPAANARASLPI